MLGLIILLLVVAGASAVFFWHARAETRRLHAKLDAAAEELQHLQRSFSRFAPQQVVDRIAARGTAQAQRQEVTVLFADLVSFTPLSESLEPEVLVTILNGYFRRMSHVITEHRGHVAKFIGDGLMALFGVLEPNPWQTNDAVHAALAMRAALTAYNQELRAAGHPGLRVGIGIHRGTAVAGVIGSHELVEFTVIGHTVNLAARVEQLTRTHERDILVTAAVHAALDPRFRLLELPAMAVRGIADPVVTFAVEGYS